MLRMGASSISRRRTFQMEKRRPRRHQLHVLDATIGHTQWLRSSTHDILLGAGRRSSCSMEASKDFHVVLTMVVINSPTVVLSTAEQNPPRRSAASPRPCPSWTTI